jgi:hypothetical protein
MGMAVHLKRDTPTVIESLRTARRADDATSRLRENSFEAHTDGVRRLVESTSWKYGPAELVATMPHHAVAKTSDGKLVRVEWSKDPERGYLLGSAKVFESRTPAADLGAELFETARVAVDKILDGDHDGLDTMISTMAEALDASGGDLQRRLTTELSLRSIRRDAWWHKVVDDHFGSERPHPPIVDESNPSEAMGALLHSLKEAASVASASLRIIDGTSPDEGLTTVAHDIAQDIAHAMAAVMNVDRENETEMVNVYETVVSVSGHLLNGAEFLAQIADTTKKDRE